MNKKLLLVSICAVATGFIAWIGTEKPNSTNKAIDLANFDQKVKPGDDFYQYVNGTWIKNNPVPSSERVWGSFSEVQENNLNNLHAIVKEAAADTKAPKGSIRQKVGDLFALGMDSAKLEKDGISPLKEELAAIEAIKTQADVVKVLARHHSTGINSLFAAFVDLDDKNSSVHVVKLYQAGLGLPDRDYYLSEKPERKNLRTEYLTHLKNVLQLLGDKPEVAEANAKVIIDMETELARVARTRVDLRNPEANYNKRTIKELGEMAPGIDWSLYLKTLGVSVPDIIVGQPASMSKASDLVKNTSIANMKTYLRWHLARESAPYLNNAMVQENFRFYGTVLSGVKQMRPRWKRSLETVDQMIGEGLGQLFTEKHFSAESKKKVNEMVDNLIAAYKDRIYSRDWMSPETKKQAVAKLGTIMRKLAYPDNWRDYSALNITRDSYMMNVFRAVRFETARRFNKIGKPVDRTEWQMSPPTVNAYYNPSMNEIVFPAGIMQPPFFHPGADDAVNYGSMGAVIGHELTHGFDDQGSQFDAEGNLKNWWTTEDQEKFKEKSTRLVKQFDNFVAIDSLHVVGALTLGENIADLGGLTLAYHAYKRSLTGKPAPEKIDGFTGDQRFFISWAQAWRVNFRPEYLKQMVITDPHAPGNFRVLGPLSNMKEFHEAFGVKPGDKMYKPDGERIEIW